MGIPQDAQQNVQPGPPVKVSPAPNAPRTPAPITPGTTIIPPPMQNVPLSQQPKPLPEGKATKPKKELKYKSETFIPEGMHIDPPDQRITTKPNLKQSQGRLKKDGTRVGAESDEDFANRVENAWIFKEIQARHIFAHSYSNVQHCQRLPAYACQ